MPIIIVAVELGAKLSTIKCLVEDFGMDLSGEEGAILLKNSLLEAVKSADLDVVRYLYEKARTTLKEQDLKQLYEDVFHEALKYSNLDTVKYLYEESLEFGDQNPTQALNIAVKAMFPASQPGDRPIINRNSNFLERDRVVAFFLQETSGFDPESRQFLVNRLDGLTPTGANLSNDLALLTYCRMPETARIILNNTSYANLMQASEILESPGYHFNGTHLKEAFSSFAAKFREEEAKAIGQKAGLSDRIHALSQQEFVAYGECPISQEEMTDPVQICEIARNQEGAAVPIFSHVYGREAIETWLAGKYTDPLTGEEKTNNSNPASGERSEKLKPGKYRLVSSAPRLKEIATHIAQNYPPVITELLEIDCPIEALKLLKHTQGDVSPHIPEESKKFFEEKLQETEKLLRNTLPSTSIVTVSSAQTVPDNNIAVSTPS